MVLRAAVLAKGKTGPGTQDLPRKKGSLREPENSKKDPESICHEITESLSPY